MNIRLIEFSLDFVVIFEKERKGEKGREKERRREKKTEKEKEKREKEKHIERKDRIREKRREKEREKMSRVNYYQSASNSQKEKLNWQKCSKSQRVADLYIYNRSPSL